MRQPIHTLTDNGVDTTPWAFDSCRSCGYLAKVNTTTQEETR